MRWIAGIVLAVAFGVGLLVLYQHRDGGGHARSVAARSTTVATGKPKSLDDIFRLRGEDFLGALADRTSQRADRIGFDRLSPSEAALLDVGMLQAEVNNGGFDQYFGNSSGDRARGALAGLEAIGAEKTAAIARRAMAVFGSQGPPPARQARWEQMQGWKPELEAMLDALDEEFYRDPDPLAELMERHCRAHRDAFAP
jgi:predicted outer membrane lipoprotein